MRLWGLVAVGLIAGAGVAHAEERRCGWLQNPTPGNWYLDDASGSWTLATQGGSEAEGMDMIPDISERDYVRTNGVYGYACACMTAEVDRETKTVLRISGFRQLKLAQCRKDRSLPKPE